MKRYSFFLLLAVAIIAGVAGCHVKASLGLGTITLNTDLTVEDWAQANFLKAVDDLIAKVPDPNKKDGDDEEPAIVEHEVPGVEDLGDGAGDAVDGG